MAAITAPPPPEPVSLVTDFYFIALKRNFPATVRYGQQAYDFDEGVLTFIAPNQVFALEFDPPAAGPSAGWVALLHPDFLWNTPLARKITQYEYFGYAVREALHLSDREEQTITTVIQHINQEYHAPIDEFSQDVIIAQLEVLLTYSERFYRRQFLTRKKANHELLSRLETILDAYLASAALPRSGLPTVQYLADALHVSPTYLSTLLKTLTGQSTQHYIHDKLLEKAKERLSTTTLTVSEIAYELGFEHPQSFSKLFKAKTSLSPLAFRQSFN